MGWKEIAASASRVLGYEGKFKVVDGRTYTLKARELRGKISEYEAKIAGTDDRIAAGMTDVKKAVSTYGQNSAQTAGAVRLVRGHRRVLAAQKATHGQFVSDQANLELYVAFQEYVQERRRKDTDKITEGDLEKLFGEFEVEGGVKGREPEFPATERGSGIRYDKESQDIINEALGENEAARLAKERKGSEADDLEGELEKDLGEGGP